MQAQQLVEEQRRQLSALDMDNQRISEQINLEIQRVKVGRRPARAQPVEPATPLTRPSSLQIKFQEKLQELAPVPELLKATQLRLADAQQQQAGAEHRAEQLARELNCAREKVRGRDPRRMHGDP